MATRTIGAKVALDGEKEFKQAIKEINSGLGVLNSEMKKTTAEYASNANSVEALSKKGDILERTLLTQKDKVEELRKALENAKQEYGEADTRTMKWEKSLNEAEAELYKTEDAIKANNAALQEAGKKSTDYKKIATAAFTAVTAAITAAVAAGKKLIDMTTNAAAGADNILTLSQITGIDTQSIQELQYASELIDVSFETIQGSLTKLKRNMQSAQEGTGAASEAFKQLGVAVTDSDGQLRNAQEVFYDAIDALGNMGNETERDALAMNIFGKSAEDLNPLIIQGAETLKGYADEAHEMAAVLTDEQLAALGSVDDAYQRMQQTQESVKNQMAAELAPTVTELYTTWTEFMIQAGKALKDSGVLDSLKNILQALSDMIPKVDSASGDSIPKLDSAMKGLKTTLDAVAIGLAAIHDYLSLIVHLSTFQFGKAWIDIGKGYENGKANNTQKAIMRAEGRYDQYADFYGYNAGGTDNWRGGLTWVGESGPELVSLPKGSSVYSNQESKAMSGDTYNITIDAKSVKEFNDIIRIAQNSRVTARMRG